MNFRIFICYSQLDFFEAGNKIRSYLSDLFPDAHVYIDQIKSKGQKWKIENERELRTSDLVIAITVDEKLSKKEKKEFRNFEGVIMRIITLNLIHQAKDVLDKADIVISPNLNEIGILDLDTVSLSKAIKAGEEATLKWAPEIHKTIEEMTAKMIQVKKL